MNEKKTVLIVDDAYFMRNEISRVLREEGYYVIGEAKNGKEGVKMFFELEPDIVTMDINMPEMDGIEATRQILSKVPDANIIIVTGDYSDELQEEAMRAGAKAYVKKPFQPAFLLTKIEALYEQQEKLVEFEDDEESLPSTVEEDNEEDFFSEEIELLNEPVPERERVIVIKNEDDAIEFPDSYPVEEEREKYALTQKRLEQLNEQTEQENETTQQQEEDVVLSSYDKPPSFEEERSPHYSSDNEDSDDNSSRVISSYSSRLEEESSIRIKPPRSKNYYEHLIMNKNDEEIDEPVLNNDSLNQIPKQKKKKGLFSSLFDLLKK